MPHNLADALQNWGIFGMTWAEIIFQLGLMIVGIMIALWYGDLGKPRLEFEIMPTNLQHYPQVGREHVRFPHIKVKNNPRRIPFTNRQTAYDCNGTIEFLSSTRTPITEKMPISWSGNPEPIKFELDPQSRRIIQLPEPGLMRARRFMNLPPDYSESIDIAARIIENGVDDMVAYGWTPESYQHNWRHPNYRIPQGQYIARVVIASGSHVFTKDFLLNNPAEFDRFDLQAFNAR